MGEAPYRAGIGHVGGEESGEHFVADVVVGGDVEERVGEGVGGAGEGGEGAAEGGGESCGVCELGAVLDEELCSVYQSWVSSCEKMKI